MARARPALDPQVDYWFDSWEVFRCCLLRTLMSHRGVPTSEGGAELMPDLAAGDPDVSPDGLTWTFRLKEGLPYAPPFQDTEIVSTDIVRALERSALPRALRGYTSYYSVIDGFDEFASGKSESISGLGAPDPHTLVVQLREPVGDLGYRFTLPASAPIPPGAADGHEDGYGRYLVASGPYMVEGSEQLDFSPPPDEQEPLSGYTPGMALTLVRNPSWDPATDDLRPANPNRIELTLGGSAPDAYREMEAGRTDVVLNGGPPPQAPLDLVARVSPSRIMQGSRDFVRYVTLNLAVPPFDDVHVRRALNLAVNKSALQEAFGGPIAAEPAGHVVIDSLTNDLLSSYDPYASPDHEGDRAAARREMAASAYDTNADGRCDDPSCRGVEALAPNFAPIPAIARSIRDDLVAIGIDLDVQLMGGVRLFSVIGDPRRHIPMAIGAAWGKDYLSASNFILPLFSKASIGGSNFSLVGASSLDLRRWGYEITSVPGIDDRIARCQALIGSTQIKCWADIDVYLTEVVVPWIPLLFEKWVGVVSDRVTRASFDQLTSLPALDRIAVQGSS